MSETGARPPRRCARRASLKPGHCWSTGAPSTSTSEVMGRPPRATNGRGERLSQVVAATNSHSCQPRHCWTPKLPRTSALITLIAVIALLLQALLAVPASCSEEASAGPGEQAAALSHSDLDQDTLMLSTRLPRQQFRLGLGPTARPARAGSTFKLVQIQRAKIAQPAGGGGGATKAAANKSEGSPGSKDGQVGPRRASLPKGTGKKISSATLKKLLGQSLPKAVNATGSQAPARPPASATTYGKPSSAGNFKFVFIQRTNATKKHGPSVPSSLAGTKAKDKHRDSLAASVSKQLASSLLYSAASSLISASGSPNSMPSLSALAALAHSANSFNINDNQSSPPGATDSAQSASAPTKEDASANEIDRPTNLVGTDIKRLGSGSGGASSSSSSNNNNNKGGSGERSKKTGAQAGTKTRKSRPSKIYNLPVKFVANGQPSGVVFHSIKQHFATIKRLQAIQKQNNGGGGGGGGGDSTAGTKRKRTQHGNRVNGALPTRLTGTNSRLIYLPLKYLSNAKPHMLSSVVRGAKASGASHTKASHKTSPRHALD